MESRIPLEVDWAETGFNPIKEKTKKTHRDMGRIKLGWIDNELNNLGNVLPDIKLPFGFM